MSIKPVAMIPEDEMQCLIDGHTAIVIPVGDELPDEVCTTLYAIPDTHRVVSVEDLKLLLSFAPGEIPKGLDPTFYFTLTQDGDERIGSQIARIRAIIEDKP